MNKRFLVVTFLVVIYSGLEAKPWLKHTAKWVWDHKTFSAACAMAVSAMGHDAYCLASGDYKNKSWQETAKESYKGLLGAATLPLLWYIYHYYGYGHSPTVRVKEGGYSYVKTPYFNAQGRLQKWYKRSIKLPKRTIKQYYAIGQGATADCGYFALYNALCLKTGNIGALFNKGKIKKLINKWKKSVAQARRKKYYDTGTSNITSGEMEEIIIKKHISRLRGQHYADGMKTVFLQANVSLIDNVSMIEQMIKTGVFGGVDRHTIHNIKRFQMKKTPQIILVNNSFGDVYKNYDGSWHWIAIKLEYVHNNVQCTVVDSLNRDVSNNSILDHLINVFVNGDIACC